MTITPSDKVTYEQFREEWLSEIEDGNPAPLEKGRRFAAKLITQWLGVTTDDDDFVICDGSSDGGIDAAYLQRADVDPANQDDNTIEGDTWYIVQSKYGTAFEGSETILVEGNKIIATLSGQNQHLADDSRRLVAKLDLFQQQASESDRINVVFATTDPIAQQDRQALENIKILGRERVFQNFDVEEVSLRTIWEALDDGDPSKLSVPVTGNFVEQSSNLLVGTVPLLHLFDFLKEYQQRTGNLDQLYERNVRQFLGNRRKINKGIAATLNDQPDKFGLYNNGITIVVSNFSRADRQDGTVTMYDPYVVNGCQTTRTIWQVLDGKLQSGGTGQNAATDKWKELASRGGVVTKIVRSDDAEIVNITRYTNSQNSVREQDFLALDRGFQTWARDMAQNYDIYLEIQRGGIESRKAWEKQHPEVKPFDAYVNAFDLIKVYGAGWLGTPGLAFSKNPPFLPNGSVYERMVKRDTGPAFGAADLYAAYMIKCAADDIGFGRNAKLPSRRQSRFLFYHIIMRMLHNVVLLTPEFQIPPDPTSVLTDAVINLTATEAQEQFTILNNAAIALIDQYLTIGSASPHTAHKEVSFNEIHNGDLNGFLKAEALGQASHSPLLEQLIAQHNSMFTSIPAPMLDGLTQREFVAKALIEN